jgi:hypothetical protein
MKAVRSRLGLALAGVAFLTALVAPAVAQAGTNHPTSKNTAPASTAAIPKQSWAVVAGDGTLARSTTDVLSSSRIAAGAYQVLTNHAVTGCAYVADPGVTGSVGSVGAPAFTVTALRAGTTTGVFVNSFDKTGASVDFPFHLHIDCNPKGTWAVINSDGTVSRGSLNVTGAIDLGGGSYEVDFSRKVKKCAYTGNVGNPGAGNPAALTMSLATRSGNPFGIFVRIQDTAGTGTTASFHVDLACGTRALYAVVDSTGTFVRGGNSTGSTHLGAGQYEVDFNRNVSNCAFVASVAQPNIGVAPQGTATVAGRFGNPLGVFVQTYDLTGTQVDRPFHLIVYC